MTPLFALDVAILPPPAIRQIAIDLSASLPEADTHGLRLDDARIPHITLTQLFVRTEELEAVLEKVDETLRGVPPLELAITGSGKGSSAVWMAVGNTPELQSLHERIMEATRGLERPGGTPAAFVGGDARVGDVLWVASYRLKSSFGRFTPHITIGHASEPPDVTPMPFTADTIVACQLGRFCTCRDIRRLWTLI
jgi:2'-5' RNA ligase